MREIESAAFTAFVVELEKALNRKIASVLVLALHGQAQESVNVESAIAFTQGFDEAKPGGKFVRYEVNIRYTNKDEIRETFESKVEAVKFLRALA